MRGHRDYHFPMITILLPLASISLLAVPVPPQVAPAEVVRALFSDHFKHSMGFSKASVARKAKWLSADFLKQLNQELDRPSNPDEGPNIDGDPFTDSQEYPTRFQVGKATAEGALIRVPVLTSGNGRRHTIVAVLRDEPDGWRVDDLVYEEGKTLRNLLGK